MSPDLVRVCLDSVTSGTFQIFLTKLTLLLLNSVNTEAAVEGSLKPQNWTNCFLLVLCRHFTHETLHVWDIKQSILCYSFMVMLSYK